MFTTDFPEAHYLLTKSGSGTRKPAASIQLKVYNAASGVEGAESVNALDDNLQNFNSTKYSTTHVNQIADGHGKAKWRGMFGNEYSINNAHTALGYVGTGGLRIPNSGAHWPFQPNASGQCNADEDFNNFNDAKQNCGNHPIFGLAISVRPSEMAASYKLKLKVTGTATNSH